MINNTISITKIMHEVYKDKAGNRILKNPLTGQLEGRNREGGLLDKSSFKTLAKRGKIKENFKFI